MLDLSGLCLKMNHFRALHRVNSKAWNQWIDSFLKWLPALPVLTVSTIASWLLNAQLIIKIFLHIRNILNAQRAPVASRTFLFSSLQVKGLKVGVPNKLLFSVFPMALPKLFEICVIPPNHTLKSTQINTHSGPGSAAINQKSCLIAPPAPGLLHRPTLTSVRYYEGNDWEFCSKFPTICAAARQLRS